MIVPLALLDVELDLNLWPEALDALRLIPCADLELDAPRNLLALAEGIHERCPRLSHGRLPFFDTTVFVRHGMEADCGLWCAALRLGRIVWDEQSQ